MKWAALGLVFGLMVATVATPARADEAASVAREHFKRGTRAYDLGRFGEAAAEYEKAYEAKESPALLYNLGQAYRAGGEKQKALNAYRSYLRNAKDAPNREEVTRLIETLKRTIEAEKATMERPPVGPVVETPSAKEAVVAQPVTPPVVEPVVVERHEPDQHALAVGKKLRIAGIVVGGVGVAALVTAGVFAAQTADVNHQLNNPSSSGNGKPVYDKALANRGHTDQILETSLFVVGGAALVAGVTSLVIGSQKIKRNRYALSPVVGPNQAGAAFTMGF